MVGNPDRDSASGYFRNAPIDFVDAGCCGTAAIITPVGSITWRDRKAVYVEGDVAGEHCTNLYERLVGIQLGDVEDKHGWIRTVPEA